jgi:hypothetical protein
MMFESGSSRSGIGRQERASLQPVLAKFLGIGILALAFTASAELPPLIPRELLFGSPATAMGTPKLSPNGRYLSYVTLDPDSLVYNVWLRTFHSRAEPHERVKR